MEFQRLTRHEDLSPDQRAFLSRSYDLKSAADYETGLDAEISPAQSTEALDVALRFVERIWRLLEK